jgi:predicted metal-dependent hydrolase
MLKNSPTDLQLSLFDAQLTITAAPTESISQKLSGSVAQVLQTIISPFQPKLPSNQITPVEKPKVVASKPRSIALSRSQLEYTLRRSKRRTLGFLIDHHGLTVSAPRWVTITQIEEAIREKETWIAKKTLEWRQQTAQRDELKIVWGDGAKVKYMGADLTVRLDDSAEVTQAGILHTGDKLLVALPAHATADQIKNRVQSWLQAKAKEIFALRIPFYSERLGHAPKRWGLSSARTRWGSCAADGSIRLNWRLVHFPVDIIDYVIAHELAHLKELNHGPDFWNTVGELFPEYQEKRSWLKQFHAH